MKYIFELYISKEALSKDDFEQLYGVVMNHIGWLAKARFHMKLSSNSVRYFIESHKDLQAISGSIDFGILQRVSNEALALPAKTTNESFVNFVKGGSLIDLKERISVKRSKSLEHFVCDSVRVSPKKAKIDIKLYFSDDEGKWTAASKIGFSFPAHLFVVDFKTATNFMKKEMPKYLNIEKALPWLSPDRQHAVLEVDTFPYSGKPQYFDLSTYEFDKHSMIVGASGSGKSKFIELMVDRIQTLPNAQDYRIAVIDPHASLATGLQRVANNPEQIQVIDFGSEGAELFSGSEDDITAATELTTGLFKSLMQDSYNPRVERILRFSLYVLFSANKMSMGNLKTFLIDTQNRAATLDAVEDSVPHNIIQFFNTDYNELRTAHYNESLLPIISLVDEMELQPTFLAEGGISLQRSINDRFLTVFSLNKVSMGEKVVKTVAGLLIQQVFLLAQSGSFRQKVLLFIDEVSVVQTPVLASILSEARKYNLFVFLTQQYFTQVEKGLRDSIFANVSNYYAFRVSEEDAQQLAGNLPMELPKDIVMSSKEEGLDQDALKIRFLTELNPRECIVRVAAGGNLIPSVRARTLEVDYKNPLQKSKIKKSTQRITKAHTTQTDLPSPRKLRAYKSADPTVSLAEFQKKAELYIDQAETKPVTLDNIPTTKNEKQNSTSPAPSLPRSPDMREPIARSSSRHTSTVVAPTLIRFAMSGTPIVDRGMPDINELLKQESTKTTNE